MSKVFRIAAREFVATVFTKGFIIGLLIFPVVAGLVAYLVWYIVSEIIGTVYAMNIFKAMVSGALAGMLGFGWLALLHRLPDRLLKITRMR